MVYAEIYSKKEEVKLRLGLDDSADPVLEIYQKDADEMINHSIRRHIGLHDVYGYDIILPLTGDNNVIDSDTVTIAIDGTIQKIANDFVIGMYRKDTAEDETRTNDAIESLQKYLNGRFGHVNDIPLDFENIEPGV